LIGIKDEPAHGAMMDAERLQGATPRERQGTAKRRGRSTGH
jgi:hypothetical protein